MVYEKIELYQLQNEDFRRKNSPENERNKLVAALYLEGYTIDSRNVFITFIIIKQYE